MKCKFQSKIWQQRCEYIAQISVHNSWHVFINCLKVTLIGTYLTPPNILITWMRTWTSRVMTVALYEGPTEEGYFYIPFTWRQKQNSFLKVVVFIVKTKMMDKFHKNRLKHCIIPISYKLYSLLVIMFLPHETEGTDRQTDKSIYKGLLNNYFICLESRWREIKLNIDYNSNNSLNYSSYE
jgi:hypothetical protein